MRSGVGIDELHRRGHPARCRRRGRHRRPRSRRWSPAGWPAADRAPRSAGPRRSACTAAVRCRICCVDALRCSGARISHTSHRTPWSVRDSTDLVVLTDYLVADPRLVRDLHDAGVPHLPVRVRDGAGLVGPMVIPGRDQSAWHALTCTAATATRPGRRWPRSCATPSAPPTGRPCWPPRRWRWARCRRRHQGGPRGGDRWTDAPPATLSTTLEFDVGAGSIVARRWPRHPRAHVDNDVAHISARHCSASSWMMGCVADIKRGGVARNAKLASLAGRDCRPRGAGLRQTTDR